MNQADDRRRGDRARRGDTRSASECRLTVSQGVKE
jgi:hypothetical protein